MQATDVLAGSMRAGVLSDHIRMRSLVALLPVLGALMVGVFAQVSVPLPFTPVPLTGQTLAVLLVSAALGPARGATSLLLYLLGGAAGLPIFAGGASGAAAVLGPTGGYLIGFVVAAWIVGGLAARGLDRRVGTTLAIYAVGSAVIYLFGASWLALVLRIGPREAFDLGVAPFVVGDVLKALLAAGLLPTAWRVSRRREREHVPPRPAV